MTSVQLGQFLAAVAGAVLAGLFKWIDGVFERRRRRESTLVAIVSEVRCICDLIRHQGYYDFAHEQANAVRRGAWDGRIPVIDIRANYFSVFEALSSELGLLEPKHVTNIVGFYAYCKSLIDSTRPDGPLVQGADAIDPGENVLRLEGLLAAILLLGKEIGKLPKRPIPKALASK